MAFRDCSGPSLPGGRLRITRDDDERETLVALLGELVERPGGRSGRRFAGVDRSRSRVGTEVEAGRTACGHAVRNNGKP